MKNLVVKWTLGIAFLLAFNVCLHAYGHDNPLVSWIVGILVGVMIGWSDD